MSPGYILSLIWTQLCLVLALLGNFFLLYASICHGAIRLDKTSVWILRNLAVADILNVLFLLLPIIVSLYAGEWVFGVQACNIQTAYKWCFALANVFLLNALALNKLLRCVYPLRCYTSSLTQRAGVTAATVLFSVIHPVWQFYAIYHSNILVVTFSRSQCLCWSFIDTKASSKLETAFNAALQIGLNAVPSLTLLVLNTLLIVYAVRKSTSAVKKTNIVVVVLVIGAFLSVSLTHLVYGTLRHGVSWDDSRVAEIRVLYFSWFFINIINPFIYVLTNEGFRAFTWNFVRCRIVRTRSSNNSSIQSMAMAPQERTRIAAAYSQSCT